MTVKKVKMRPRIARLRSKLRDFFLDFVTASVMISWMNCLASYINAFRFLPVCAILCAMTNYLWAADPVVSNVSAVQRAGTKFVDIRYDLASLAPTVRVTLEVSQDGGLTYNVPVTSTTGAIGDGVTVGLGKTIVWNAGVDWDGMFSNQMRFRLLAANLQPPPLEGFAGVTGGSLPAGGESVDSFYMGKTEVVSSEWQTVHAWATENGYVIGSGQGLGPKKPVVSVSWYDAVKWCNAYSEKEGLTPTYKDGASVYRTGETIPTIDAAANGYRLPSEKEWEFAARGGVNTNGYAYSGSNDINEVAWYFGNRRSIPDSSYLYLADVATKQANELGISDMSGNVREWCFDALGTNRVIRGGGTGYEASSCSVAFRISYEPYSYNGGDGFRVARSFTMANVGSASSVDSLLDTRNWTISIIAPVNGAVTGAGAYLRSIYATLTAVPNPGCRFTGWTGDASGTENPLTITMDADKTVAANFERDLSDTDNDGLTAFDELTIHGTNPLLADTDGDGLSDKSEIRYQGSYFTIIEGYFSRDMAAADAIDRRGRLAVFSNLTDYNRMVTRWRSLPNGRPNVWLGLSYSASDGAWRWTDGSTPSFTRWQEGITSPDGFLPEMVYAGLMGESYNGEKWHLALNWWWAGHYFFERVGLDPLSSDTDADGINDGAEVNTYKTSPVLDDTDADGLSDGAEINTHITNPNSADSDSDGLSDNQEVINHGTNPSVKDTDDDGFDDLFEINTGYSPLQQTSSPDALSTIIRTAVEFRFFAGNGANYTIESSFDLQTWEVVESNISGTGGVVTRFYSTGNLPTRYFRVKRN